MNKSIIIGLFLLLSARTLFSQPAADMPVATYNDNTTPYPLYAGKFGSEPSWTTNDLQLLANNFDGLYGNYSGITAAKAAQIRSIRSDFQFQKYNGGWTFSSTTGTYSISNIEQNYPNDILYYQAGSLASSIDAATTTITISNLFGTLYPSTATTEYTTSYKSGSTWYYITWLKIDNEFMRITGVNGNTLTVIRGFKSTTATAHTTNTAIVCPVYGTALSASAVQYRSDEGGMVRWNILSTNLASEWTSIQGGIWIDILFGNLSQCSMDGTSLPGNRIWDIHKNQIYVSTDRSQNTEKGIKMMQDNFYSQFGTYPDIWGNNMLFPTTLTDDRIKMLLQDAIKPRPIDGFAQENSFGGYGTDGGSGKVYADNSYTTWQTNIQSIMYMGEQKINARPLSLDGGQDNGTFASESDALRHRVLLYGYASYLIAVKVEPDNKIYTKLGLTPVVVPASGTTYIKIEPFLQFKIGRPVQTYTYANYMNYKMSGRNVFVRKFENGIVLVNPSEVDENNIDLTAIDPNHQFYNPDVNTNTITTLSLPKKNGAILLYSGTTGVSDISVDKIFKVISLNSGNVTINITPDVKPIQIFIYNSSGKILFSSNDPQNILSFNNMSAGIWMIKLVTNNGSYVNKIIIK